MLLKAGCGGYLRSSSDRGTAADAGAFDPGRLHARRDDRGVPLLPTAIVLITAALVLYSLGVWAERIRQQLRWWHAACFAAGLACDASGTLVMTRLAALEDSPTSNPFLAVMAVTGAIAIILMAVHLVWAVLVLLHGGERARHRFHRLSFGVWLIWLVPYLTGAIGANLR